MARRPPGLGAPRPAAPPGMTPPENSPPPKSAELKPKQVPWGAAKPAPKPTAPPPEPPAALSAKKVPWGAHKPPPPTPLPDPTVTHMPWAEPTRPPIPPAPPPTVSAKKVPWSWRKKKKPEPEPAKPQPEERPAALAAWALPKGATPLPLAQQEMEFARDLPARDKNEPTAEQLVAYLSRLPSRKGEPQGDSSPQMPYKARPISFEPTRWEIFLQWAQAHRRQLSIGGVLLVLILVTADLLRLVSMNSQIDREWRTIETALHERYTLLPGYVECVSVYSEDETYALALAQRSLAAWQKARSDQQIATAAVQMERVMNLLIKIMNRYDQFVPAKDPDQEESSQNFILLERKRERSRRETAELVRHYNTVVADFNGRVGGFPGSLIAWTASLHERVLLFSSNN